ncbi:hypothetical protein O7635_11595 [Asanoa sp. WMMD1127]|uniref:hypothetical protein n=1 Tax=Asanoa sp. WMMD1127 TaxID=3016107 RepID=UPI002416DCE1|nr:hypothetical protein [Asanoa sp. WMMD1127]MDG4822493.1 hypothetical protein [Asanoa sp. WMMD1127]
MTAKRRLLTFLTCSVIAGVLLLVTVVFSLRDHTAASWLTGAASLLVWATGLVAVWPVITEIRTGDFRR